jgi:hypothetical protein
MSATNKTRITFHRSRIRNTDGNNIKKRISDNNLRRYQSIRKIIDGFPWDGVFKSKQEVHDYLKGDKIQCLLCGKWFKMLATHIVRVHNISVDDYKIKYQIPWTYGLICSDSAKKCRQNCIKRIKNGELSMVKISNFRKSYKQHQRPLTKYFSEDQAERGRQALAKYNKLS